jgi:enamine deaminase RidA (YjgF/YER057c/UK114 family)
MTIPVFHKINGTPDPLVPFSHGVEQEGRVFVTGQTPFTQIASTLPYPEGMEMQTHQVMANLRRALEGRDLGFEIVVAVRFEIDMTAGRP